MRETINLRQTWRSTVPLLVLLLQHGETAESREFARNELLRLAEIADKLQEAVQTK